MALANLIEKHRLTRSFSVVTGEGVFEVAYNGTGFGYEEILVNGETARRTGSFWWYVPKFEFFIGNLPSSVLVSVSPLMKISKFTLLIDGRIVYRE